MVTTNGSYLRSLPGVIKIGGIALLTLIISLGGHSYSYSTYNLVYKLDDLIGLFPLDDFPSLSYERYFLGVTSIVYTLSILSLTLHWINVGVENGYGWKLVDILFHSSSFLLLIIAGSLLIASARRIDGFCSKQDETTPSTWSTELPITFHPTTPTESSTTELVMTTAAATGEDHTTTDSMTTEEETSTTEAMTTVMTTTEEVMTTTTEDIATTVTVSTPYFTTDPTTTGGSMTTEYASSTSSGDDNDTMATKDAINANKFAQLLAGEYNPGLLSQLKNDYKCQYKGEKEGAGSLTIITSLLYLLLSVVLFLRRNSYQEPSTTMRMQDVGL